jgi:hypothetical protein
MAVMLIARFEGDLGDLIPAYDRAHALIMSRGGAVPSGELRHRLGRALHHRRLGVRGPHPDPVDEH